MAHWPQMSCARSLCTKGPFRPRQGRRFGPAGLRQNPAPPTSAAPGRPRSPPPPTSALARPAPFAPPRPSFPPMGSPTPPAGATETPPAPISIQLLLFAAAREAAGGARRVALPLPPGTPPGEAVRAAIVAALPGLADLLPSCALAVNAEYVDEGGAAAALVAGDELAVIPPISGG